MTQFNPENASKSDTHRQVYQAYGYVYNAVDFTAGLCFLIGSVMFFYHGEVLTMGTWLFVIGSALFIIRPGVKLGRELHLSQLRDPLE